MNTEQNSLVCTGTVSVTKSNFRVGLRQRVLRFLTSVGVDVRNKQEVLVEIPEDSGRRGWVCVKLYFRGGVYE